MLTLTKKHKPSPTERRRAKAVAIAKDVLFNLRTQKYSASPGQYCSISSNFEEADPKEGNHQSPTNMQKVMVHNSTTCDVCAIGSLIASDIKLNNKFSRHYDLEYIDPTDKDDDGTTFISRLEKFFTRKELVLMEHTFECCPETSIVPNHERYRTPEESDRAADLGRRYSSDNDRLAYIMTNVVRNKGQFILPKRI